jgi:4-hydroxythreonine-4-phosphate dehydrogenase
MAQAALLAIAAGEPAGIGPDLCLQLAQQEGQALVVLADKNMLQQRAALLGLNVQWHDYDPQYISPLPSGHLRVLHIPTAQPVQAGQLNSANSPYVLNLLIRAMQGCPVGRIRWHGHLACTQRCHQ